MSKFKKVFVVNIAETELRTCWAEDEELAVFDYYLTAQDEDNVTYVHHHIFRSTAYDEEFRHNVLDMNAPYKAGKLQEKVMASGLINLDHWSPRERAPSYALGEVSEWDMMDDEERSVRSAQGWL